MSPTVIKSKAISSIMTKVEMAKDTHLHMENFLPCVYLGQIGSKMLYGLVTNGPVTSTYINWFRLNLPPEIPKKITLANAMDILCHFNFLSDK